MTIIGYILLVFCIFSFRRVDLLYKLTIFSIPFTATSIVNFTIGTHSIGVQPIFMLGSFWMLSFLINAILRGQVQLLELPVKYMSLLLIFFVICVLSVLKHYIVYPQYNFIIGNENIELYTPLPKLLYLLFGIVFSFFLVFYNNNIDKVIITLRIVLFSGLFVLLWGAMQLTCHYLNIEYPSFIFNNSISTYALGYNGTFSLLGGDVKRISSVATEPSILGAFLVIPMCYLLSFLQNRRAVFLTRFSDWLLLISFMCFAILTTSSALTLSLLFAIAVSFVYRSGGKEANKSNFIVFLVIITAVVIGLLFALPSLKEHFYINILHKLNTFSGQQRLGSILTAFAIFIENPILGFGFSSITCHDTVVLLLSTVGILGFIVFFLLAILLIIDLWRANKMITKTGNYKASAIYGGTFLCLLATLFYNQISGFSYVYPMSWFVLGISMSLPLLNLKVAQ